MEEINEPDNINDFMGYYKSSLAKSVAGKNYILKNTQVYFANFHLILLNTTEAFYKYVRSKNLQTDSKGNPFAEPVPVYNNITNGYGIFGLYAKDVFTKGK